MAARRDRDLDWGSSRSENLEPMPAVPATRPMQSTVLKRVLLLALISIHLLQLLARTRFGGPLLPLLSGFGQFLWLIAGAATFAGLLLCSRRGRRLLVRAVRAVGRWGEQQGSPLAWSITLALIACWGADELRYGPVRTTPLNAESMEHVEGAAYRVAVWVEGYDQLPPLRSRMVILESGRPLGPGHSYRDEIINAGSGRFCHGLGEVLFSASDGSDPRTNGRRYELQYPWWPPFRVRLLLLLAVLGLQARRLDRGLRTLREINPAWTAGALFLLALVYRVVVAAADWNHLHDNQIRGFPLSDAQCWGALSTDFARGWRSSGVWELWGARRPLYYVFAGSIMALCGDSLWSVRVVQELLGAIGTVLVFDSVRRLAGFPVALAAALGQALVPYDARTSLSPMSEPLGAFLTLVSLWYAVRAWEAHAAGSSWWKPLALSGMLLMLSNLARPLTLVAAPMVAMGVGLLGPGPRRWRTLAGMLAVFLGAAALTALPWLARQYLVHGILALSDNQGEALFAATSPRYGYWSAEISQLTSSTDIRERTAFYQTGVRQNLREYPLFFPFNAAKLSASSMSSVRLSIGPLLLGCVVGVMGGTRVRSLTLRLLGAGLACVGFSAFVTFGAWWVWATGAVAVLLLRLPLGLPVLLLIGSCLTLGISGIPPAERFSYAQLWIALALTAWSCEAWLVVSTSPRRWASLLIQQPARDWGDRVAKWCARAAWLGLAFLCAGLAVAAGRRLMHSGPEPVSWLGDRTERDRWVSRFRADPRAAVYGDLWYSTEVALGVIRSDQLLEVGDQERIRHYMWAAAHPRPYPFTLFRLSPPFVQHGCGEPTGLALPGTLPPHWRGGGSRVLAVGVHLPWPRSCFEVLAMADPVSGELHFPAPPLAIAHAAFVTSEATAAGVRRHEDAQAGGH